MQLEAEQQKLAALEASADGGGEGAEGATGVENALYDADSDMKEDKTPLLYASAPALSHKHNRERSIKTKPS